MVKQQEETKLEVHFCTASKKILLRLAVHQKFFARRLSGHLWSIESIPNENLRHQYIFQNKYGGICHSPQNHFFETPRSFRGLFLLKTREGFYDADHSLWLSWRQKIRKLLHHQSSYLALCSHNSTKRTKQKHKKEWLLKLEISNARSSSSDGKCLYVQVWVVCLGIVVMNSNDPILHFPFPSLR